MADGALQTRLAEDIVLLNLLGPVPVLPSRNTESSYEDQGVRSGRALPPRVERDLTSTLAFLSSIKDDPNNVTAVCVQEVDQRLCVLMAANACGPGPSPYLESVKRGFETVFEVLKKAATTSRGELERDVFRCIVVMCRQRIISRARFTAFKNRKPLQTLLHQAIQGIGQLRSSKSRVAVKGAATRLVQSLDRCSEVYLRASNGTTPLDTQLEALIEEFRDFSEITDLSKILLTDLEAAIPKMEPSSRRVLIDIAGEMAQYRSAAARLVRIARRYAVCRRAYTLMVRLEQPAGAREGLGVNQVATLDSVLGRIASITGAGFRVDSLCRKLGKNPWLVRKEFKKTLSDTLANAKVHAEVQLIWYLEAHPAPNPPRIIASNKDACNLCNALIALHGKHTIPRSHGRIYPGWRLPATGLGDLPERFATEVERTVVRRAHEVLQDRAKKLGPPLENTLFSDMGSVTTVLTEESEGSWPSSSSSDSGKTVTDSDETVTPDTPQPVEEPCFENPEMTESGDAKPAPRTTTGSPVAGPNSCGEADSSKGEGLPGPDDSARTQDAAANTVTWLSVAHGETALAHVSDAVRLYVEYTAAPAQAGRRLQFRTRQRVPDESNAGEDSPAQPEPVYDLSCPEDAPRDLVCRKGCRVVRVKVGAEILEVELDEFG